jgi:hypothetical protein
VFSPHRDRALLVRVIAIDILAAVSLILWFAKRRRARQAAATAAEAMNRAAIGGGSFSRFGVAVEVPTGFQRIDRAGKAIGSTVEPIVAGGAFAGAVATANPAAALAAAKRLAHPRVETGKAPAAA